MMSFLTSCPTRPSIFEISTSRMASRKLGPLPPINERSAYIGWKQPASMPASSAAPAKRVQQWRTLSSSDDIDDPLWNHDYTLRRAAFKRALDGLERKHRGLDFLVGGIARDGDVGPLLAVNLNGKVIISSTRRPRSSA